MVQSMVPRTLRHEAIHHRASQSSTDTSPLPPCNCEHFSLQTFVLVTVFTGP